MSNPSLLAEGIFENRSLKDTLCDVADPKVLLSYGKLVNLVIKYFFAYRYPETVDYQVSLRDIEALVEKAAFYFHISREFSGKTYAASHDIDHLTFDFFNSHGYATSMLGDFAPTTMIVREIVTTIIERDNFPSYVGVDLGSGSGILSLAAYICAMRNGFSKQPLIMSIERDVLVLETAKRVLDTLVGKDIFAYLPFDTTNPTQMQRLVDGERSVKFAQVINENITTTGVPMGQGPDPFHQNNRVLFGGLRSMISGATQFFPRNISMLFSSDGGQTGTTILGTAQNKFEIERLMKAEAVLKNDSSVGLPVDWSIFETIYPLGVEVAGEITPMHEIGGDLYTKGMLRYFPEWRHRWSSRALGKSTVGILLPE